MLAAIGDELVLEGAPRLRGEVLRTGAGGAAIAGVWDCEPCRIELDLESDELLELLDGAIVIQTGQGETLSLERGDVAWLPAGLTCVITVRRPSRWTSQRPPATGAAPRGPVLTGATSAW